MNTDNIHVYCSPELKEKLRKLADANMRSLSAEVQMLIEQAFATHSKKQSKE